MKGTGVINLEVTWAAADLDEHSRPAMVKLLSVHEKVVNLQVDGWKHLLFVAGPKLEAGPATVSLPEHDFAFFKDYIAKSESGRYQCGVLSITAMADESSIYKSLELSWLKSNRKSFAPFFIRGTNRHTVKKALRDYRSLLAEVKSAGAAGALLDLPGGEDYFRQQIAENFPPLVEALLQNNRQNFNLHAKKLVGLGRGLTPTGDDLLHGLLITYCYMVNQAGPGETVKYDLDILAENTNLFGRHMIETGFRGLTPDIFNIFLKTIVEGKADHCLINRIGAIGSTSGYDIAFAIMVSLNMMFVKPIQKTVKKFI